MPGEAARVFAFGQLGGELGDVQDERVLRVDAAAQLEHGGDQLAQFQRQAPAGAQGRSIGCGVAAQGIFHLLFGQFLAAQVAPALDAAQHGKIAQQVQQGSGVATLGVALQALRQPARQFGGALRLAPDAQAARYQQGVGEADAALQRQAECQIQALLRAQPSQRLAQGLAATTQMLGGAVGGGDQMAGELRVLMEQLLQLREVAPVGIQ
ncbi:hypothetical protein D9M68_601570 [compost metagenome]